MLNTLNTAATGMTAQSRQIENIANNLANADTTAFKKSRTDFQDLLYHNLQAPGAATSATTQNPTGVQIGVGVRVAGNVRDHEDGTLKPTQRDLDIAIEGNGFLSIQKPNGEIAYSRDGSLRLGAEGRIETISGYPVVPEIQVPPNSREIHISFDGRVSVKDEQGAQQEIGQIQLTSFANPSGLQAEGGNLYNVSPASGAPVPGTPMEGGFGRVFQGYLESSNVNPTVEMTDMIRAQRMYEMNSKVISTADQMMNALNQIR
ncbi:MAG: flagellar basal-body rod protein FlgG [Bdellovibrionota bacterium]